MDPTEEAAPTVSLPSLLAEHGRRGTLPPTSCSLFILCRRKRRLDPPFSSTLLPRSFVEPPSSRPELASPRKALRAGEEKEQYVSARPSRDSELYFDLVVSRSYPGRQPSGSPGDAMVLLAMDTPPDARPAS